MSDEPKAAPTDVPLPMSVDVSKAEPPPAPFQGMVGGVVVGLAAMFMQREGQTEGEPHDTVMIERADGTLWALVLLTTSLKECAWIRVASAGAEPDGIDIDPACPVHGSHAPKGGAN